MSRVELYEKIRSDGRQGLSIRALANKYKVHRRTVRQALRCSVPPGRRAPTRERPVLGPYKAWIDAVLEADKAVPPKQRHTAKRIWERLRDEQGAQVACPTVRAYVGVRRRELSNMTKAVTVAQAHCPGDEILCGTPHWISYVARVNMWRGSRKGCVGAAQGAATG